jgi:hypothetical protein
MKRGESPYAAYAPLTYAAKLVHIPGVDVTQVLIGVYCSSNVVICCHSTAMQQQRSAAAYSLLCSKLHALLML